MPGRSWNAPRAAQLAATLSRDNLRLPPSIQQMDLEFVEAVVDLLTEGTLLLAVHRYAEALQHGVNRIGNGETGATREQ